MSFKTKDHETTQKEPYFKRSYKIYFEYVGISEQMVHRSFNWYAMPTGAVGGYIYGRCAGKLYKYLNSGMYSKNKKWLLLLGSER